MCLILNKDSIRTITYTDIVVYKMVRKVTRVIYRAPYYLFDYRKDVVYCGELRKSINILSGSRIVNQGFHSYARLEDIKIAAINNIVIVKCIIPEGAEFFKGHGTDGTPQYASNKIMIKEEVKL